MTDTALMRERIGQLCHQFKLPTMGARSVSRFTASGHGDALATFLEVLEEEAEDRRHRRIDRLRKEAKLPSGRKPSYPRARPGRPSSTTGFPWCSGSRWTNRLVEGGHSVLFVPAYRLVRELLAAKRDLDLPRRLRRLDNYDFLLLDDLGYPPQVVEESEVLFTLIAERYERRSLGITSNLVFSEWERIFANPMATAAAIDRVVHHSVILEFDVPGYRTVAAQQRGRDKEVNRQE